MPFIAQSNIAGVSKAGESFTLEQGKSADHLPADLLQQFIKDKVIKQVGAVDEAVPGFEETDALSVLNRKQLLGVMRDNFPKGTFTVLKSFSDEQLRAMLRKITPDVNLLKLPEPELTPTPTKDEVEDALA